MPPAEPTESLLLIAQLRAKMWKQEIRNLWSTNEANATKIFRFAYVRSCTLRSVASKGHKRRKINTTGSIISLGNLEKFRAFFCCCFVFRIHFLISVILCSLFSCSNYFCIWTSGVFKTIAEKNAKQIHDRIYGLTTDWSIEYNDFYELFFSVFVYGEKSRK